MILSRVEFGTIVLLNGVSLHSNESFNQYPIPSITVSQEEVNQQRFLFLFNAQLYVVTAYVIYSKPNRGIKEVQSVEVTFCEKVDHI